MGKIAGKDRCKIHSDTEEWNCCIDRAPKCDMTIEEYKEAFYNLAKKMQKEHGKFTNVAIDSIKDSVCNEIVGINVTINF